jgi:hypothetical protein
MGPNAKRGVGVGGARRENFTYRGAIRYNIIIRCNNASLN